MLTFVHLPPDILRLKRRFMACVIVINSLQVNLVQISPVLSNWALTLGRKSEILHDFDK